MLSTVRGALWGGSFGVQGCRGRIARGAREEGLPLAGGSGSAGLWLRVVLSQTWGCLTCLY